MTTHQSPLLGINDAARALELSHSTVSRYVKRYPELDHGNGGRPLVDVAELRQHRIDNLNVGQVEEAVRPAAPALRQTVAGTPAPAEPNGSGPAAIYNSERARREAANATKAELELAEKLGQVTSIQEVETAVFEAGQLLRDSLETRNMQLAERLARMDDPLAIQALLDEQDLTLLKDFASGLAGASGIGEDDAAAA